LDTTRAAAVAKRADRQKT